VVAVVVVVLPVIYLLPTLIGAIRRVENLPLVFVFNVIGGLTGVGWLGAMILAFGPRRDTARPVAPL
jgi:hypothetical protein